MKHPFAMRNGDKIAILRPDDPSLALRLAHECVEADKKGRSPEESEAAFQAITSAQNYSFVGLLSIGLRPSVLDANGWSIGKVKPGDSFAPWEAIRALGKMSAAEAGVQGIAGPSGPPLVVALPEPLGPHLRVPLQVQTDGELEPHATKEGAAIGVELPTRAR